MTNEIKEILAYFEKYIKILEMHDSEPMLNWKDLKLVLDYINKLQEENKRLMIELEQYKKIIGLPIIVKDHPSEEDSPYILCNMSKQELYRILSKARYNMYFRQAEEGEDK